MRSSGAILGGHVPLISDSYTWLLNNFIPTYGSSDHGTICHPSPALFLLLDSCAHQPRRWMGWHGILLSTMGHCGRLKHSPSARMLILDGWPQSKSHIHHHIANISCTYHVNIMYMSVCDIKWHYMTFLYISYIPCIDHVYECIWL